MKPIYFPFTYIPETIATALFQFLGPVIVLQPSANNQPETLRRLEHDGCIEIRVPNAEDEERLERCLTEFMEWGRLHHGEESSLKDFFKNGFSASTFTAQIRTDILKGQAEGVPSDPDPLFLSRLFLLMAQRLDLQQSEINMELALSIDDEIDLFTHMTGEQKTPGSPKENLFENDYGAYMTGSRISAWFRLAESVAEEFPFLVTTSRSVSEQILEKIPGLEKVWETDNISCRQPASVISDFADCVNHLAATPWTGADQITRPDFSAGTGRKLNLAFYLLPGANLPDAFGPVTADKNLFNVNKNSWLNTLIAFFEI